MMGSSASWTVTVKLPVVTLPAPSVAWALTVVVPIGKVDPEGGVETMAGVEQLSVAVTL